MSDDKLTTLHLDDDGVRALTNVTDAADAIVMMYEDEGDPDAQLDEDTWAMYSLLGIEREARRRDRIERGEGLLADDEE